MKRYMVIETVDQLKAISDSLRMEIITLLVKEEYTGKQLATLLNLSASKVHYHLKELENHQFVHVVRTEEKNGIVQKFYRALAYDMKVSDALLPSLQEDTILMQESLLNHLRSSITRLYNAPEESFLQFADEEKRPPSIGLNSEVRAPRHEIHEWLKKYKALINELGQMEHRYLQRVANGEAEDTEENFYLVTVGFMTNERYYVADDESLPENYEHVPTEYEHITDKVVKKKKGSDSDDDATRN
ncbi:winged helix-turn-helix domain-containing protein [Brevibacillus choshinensis]|uniref:ArsR/SmtB family transcription factor n=1 Tax=Brevibacillus choshinensis TaxID=54911 RepID=UPI002E1E7598|nr:winged helix-turn-helix domain-containing protein [Brevibacillus choshinensis]MED4753139.1 winged helix-turn-helix domain-containing protein [Brevibacillus choshinensis]MED4781282.1 winged helix-turn-helix domain-containing protein [Brevibacillus choshinensis]